MGSHRLRIIFFWLCCCIILYLGNKKNIVVFRPTHKYVEYHLVINEAMVNNRNSIKDDDGDFEDWIEIYNKGDKDINLQGFGLSNDRKQPFLWTFPDKIIESKSYCIIWASGKNKKQSTHQMHTNFKLTNKNKVIILTAPEDNWNDILLLEPMDDNISLGRVEGDNTELNGFDMGTPYKPNDGEILIDGPNTNRLSAPRFSHSGGFYTEEFDLTLSANNNDSKIYYTFDGSEPNENSILYTTPISIQTKVDKATIVRARTFKKGYPKSNIITKTYFVDKNIYAKYNIPVVSLVTNPKNLFDYEDGIYVAGKIFDEWKLDNPFSIVNQASEANYNQRGKNWEREASIELIEPNGKVGISQNIGIRIHGGYSRANNLKSFALFARKDYDEKEYFVYDFFDGEAKSKINDKKINQFSKLLLRTSATDSKYSFFRDAFTQSLVKSPMILDTQSSKASIVYINGEYYGIHNIREAYDKGYISNHYKMDEGDVVIIKNPTGVAGVEIQEGFIGDEMHYNQMITYLKEHFLKDYNNYDFIKTQIDITNFIEYNILQIYSDNRDWPGNNVTVWRKRTQAYEPNTLYGQDGRWRWLVYDLDYSFGLYTGGRAVQNNSLKRATELNGPDWPNPPWSTFLFRSLLENDDFKNQFINTFADRLNTAYSPKTVVEKIKAMEEIYYPNAMKHILRWGLHDNNFGSWLDEISGMKNFAIERPKYLYKHIIDYFGLLGTAKIKVYINEGGYLELNTINIENSHIPWEGVYFKDIPIIVRAIPNPGYIFVGWEGVNESENYNITINLFEDSYLKANFEKIMR